MNYVLEKGKISPIIGMFEIKTLHQYTKYVES